MSEPAAPIPTEDSAPYWEAAAAGRLAFQRCRSCRELQFYPRALCISCMSDDIEWVDSEGAGVIYSFSRVELAPSPEFERDLPYVIALVRLDEGIQILTRVIGADTDEVAIDRRVRVAFRRLTGDICLPVFQLAEE